MTKGTDGTSPPERPESPERPARPELPDVGKEVVSVLAGLGLFGGALVAGIPFVFAAGAGAVAFATAYALVPRRPSAAEILLAPEVTRAMLEQFLRRGRSALLRVVALRPRLHKTPMAQKVDALCDTLTNILDSCEKDPQDIRSARSVPFYVEKIEEYVSSYLTLFEASARDPDLRQRLALTEAMIVRATARFEEMHKAMLENDLRALEARAGALSMEFGHDQGEAPPSGGTKR